jgi:hypothetical protein
MSLGEERKITSASPYHLRARITVSQAVNRGSNPLRDTSGVVEQRLLS